MTITQVYLGIGSNIDREVNIRGGLAALKLLYGQLQISPVYKSKALGFEGDDFYNLVVGLKTELGVDDLAKQLREIEYQFGRCRNEIRYSSRTLDIDMLLFAELVCDKHHVPRSDIIEFSFVLKPFCDLAPDLMHPVNNKTINELWENFDSSKQKINQISLSFNS